jgi:hypothetical protein
MNRLEAVMCRSFFKVPLNGGKLSYHDKIV